MAGPSYSIQLNPAATGWTIYANRFGSSWTGSSSALDTSSTVWNGTADVTDSFAARALGAYVLTQDGSTPGLFEGTNAADTALDGTYPAIYFRQLGGSPEPVSDLAVTFGGTTVTVGTSAIATDGFTYTPNVPATSVVQTPITIWRGSAASWTITPTNTNSVTASNFECRVGLVGSSDYYSYTVANGGMSYNSGTRVFIVTTTVGDTAGYPFFDPTWAAMWQTGVPVPVGRIQIYVASDVDGATGIPSVAGIYPVTISIPGTVVAETIYLLADSPITGTINAVNGVALSAGTCTLSFRINGVNITGLGSIAASTTKASFDATALSSFTGDDEISCVIISPSSATDLRFTMTYSR